MEKHELASYLASLISIMDSMDDGGAQLRPAWLVAEYHRAYEEFKQGVKDDDEARKSEQQRQRESEKRANPEDSESGRGGPAGSGDGKPKVSDTFVRRTGL